MSVDVRSLEPLWLHARLEELASEIGRLRTGARETPLQYRVDAIASRVFWLLAATTPTASDLYRESGDVDAALETADRETRRIERLLGETS